MGGSTVQPVLIGCSHVYNVCIDRFIFEIIT